jgi:cytochrome c-type biogenesis protein CcmH/NrfG
LNRALRWLLAAALTLPGCATTGPRLVPASPLLDVPLSVRVRDADAARRVAELEIKRDWTSLGALAAAYVARDPADADWRLVLGYARLQQNNHPEALAALAPLVELHPEEVDAQNLLAEAFRLAGQRDRARLILERAVLSHPNSQVTRFLLGEVYRESNLLEQAGSAYREAIRLDASFPLGWFGLARVLARTGPQEEYAAVLQQLRALDPELAGALAAPGASPTR